MSKKDADEPSPRRWVSLTLPEDLISRIEKQAEKDQRNRSQMIRVLLLRALAANEKTA